MNDHGARMAAEMAAQPEVIAGLAARRPQLVAALRALLADAPVGTVIVARGSSDYAGIYGRYLFEAATGRPVALAAPSLTTMYGLEPKLEGWLAVGVSQSGRTPEITTVLDSYRASGARTVAVTNDPESPLAAGAHLALALGAGQELAVPATKTLVAELVAMATIAEALGPVPWDDSDWDAAPTAVADVLADPGPADRAADALGEASGLACVARGYLLAVALEAALKLREAAGVRAEGWSAADFRHGPATIGGGRVPMLAISAAGPAAADVAELAERWRDRGGTVLRLADAAGAELPFERRLPEALAVLPAVVRAQQLALALGLHRGVDPDRPPGLEKVTLTR